MADDTTPPPAWPAASGAGWSLPAQDSAVAAGTVGPRYQRTGLIGRGGMGLVYVAWDQQLGRSVAIKEADPAAGPEALARLEHEARLTAGLDHPGIVPVHDVGIGEDGRVFYAMRLVRGQPLSARIAAFPALSDRLPLVRALLDAAQAIAHAHAQGVVHRDLKPANLVVGELGETQVIDWGLARAVGSPGGGGGTPGYARPEQLAGGAASPRDDVHSLGVVLGEILQGRPPPLALPEDAPAELIAILRHALDPAGYADARALAVDLASWVDGRPVGAHRYTPVELAVRFVRAWRLPLGIAGLSLLVLTGGGLTAWRRTAVARDRAETAEIAARTALERERDRFATLLSTRAAEALTAARLPEAGVLAAAALDLRDLPEARGVLASAMAAGRLPPPERDLPLPCDRPLGLAADGALVCRDGEQAVLHASDGAVHAWPVGSECPWLTDDRRAIGMRTAAGQRLLAMDTGVPLAEFSAPAGEMMSSMPLGNLVVERPERLMFQPPGDAPARLLTTCRPGVQLTVVTTSAHQPDNQRISLACADGAVWDGDLQGRGRWWSTPLGETAAGPIGILALPDGSGFALSTVRGQIVVLDAATGALRFRTETGLNMPNQLRVSPDGRLLVAFGSDRILAVLRADTGRVLARLPVPGLRDLVFLDDRRVELLGDRLTVRALPDDLPAAELLAPAGMSGAAVSPDGQRLAAGLGDGSVILWSLHDGAVEQVVPLAGGVVKGVAWMDDRRLMAVAAGAGSATWVERAADPTGREMATTRSVPGSQRARRVVRVASGLLAASYETGLLWTHDERTEPVPGCDHDWVDLDASPDGRWAIAVTSTAQTLVIDGQRPRCPAPQGEGGVGNAAIAADGTRYLGGERDVSAWRGETRLWSAPLPDSPYDIDSSPDGRWVATGAIDGSARVFESATGRLVAVIHAHTERVAGVSFSADSRTLITASWDGRLRLHALDALVAPPESVAAWAAGWNLDLDAVLAETTLR